MVIFMLLVLQYVKILTIISALISQWFSGSSSSGFHSSQHPKVALLPPMGLAPYCTISCYIDQCLLRIIKTAFSSTA